MIDFKNINIMVGIATLFSSVSINSYGVKVKEVSKVEKDRKYKLESKSKIYTIFTPLKDLIPENLKGYKEYDEYAHSLVMSNSSGVFLTNDVGNNFVIRMIPYYESSIIESVGVLKYTKNEKVKHIAQRVIEAGKKEVESMQNLLATGELKGNENTEYAKKMQRMDMNILKKIEFYTGASNDFEAITTHYLKSMIPHHELGIEMAKKYLKYAKNEELIKVAQRVILSQEEELKELKILLNE
ncbi:MAG: DUF305 domain-containing protein [Cetobacterium sp.]